MAGFLVRRLVGRVLLIAVAGSLGYLLAATALHPRENYAGRSPAPPERVVDAKLTELNLNDATPVWRRYARWATGVVHGDLGRTWRGRPIAAELGRRLPVTLGPVLVGLVAGTGLGVLLGVFGAVRAPGRCDQLVTVATFTVLSIPVFVLATLLQAGTVGLDGLLDRQLLAVTGTAGHAAGPIARLRHLALPAACVTLGQAAVVSRYQRGALLDVLHGDFLRTARAKGLRRRVAVRRHALRAALIPPVTHLTHTFGPLLVGTAVTERVFGRHGLGDWLVDAVDRNDVTTVAAVTCVLAVPPALAGTVCDVLHALLDPRVRATGDAR